MIRFDYQREPHSDIAFIDMKSFYASVECVERGLHPLKTCLCVMSRADNASGLILASSPLFKQVYGKQNVGRSYDLPFDVRTRKFSYRNAKRQGLPMTREYIQYIESWAQRTLIVPPRMAYYIQENLKILKVLQKYAPNSDIHPYSIDEAFIDLSKSLNYFQPDPNKSRREKLDTISAQIQRDIRLATGIFSTVGMSNANPLLAKLALDNEAKHTPTMRANWSYEDVESKVWALEHLTDFWGIGSRTERRLNRLGIDSVRALAQANPEILKKEFGVIGLQLWFHAHGIDESKLSRPYRTKSKGLGNSQVLPRDYTQKDQIELVLLEMAEQVAIRLRRAHKKTTNVAIYLGFSRETPLPSLQASQKIDPSQSTAELRRHVRTLFRQRYQGGAVRSIGVRFGQLVDEAYQVYSLFEDPTLKDKQARLEQTIDQIRDQFGFLAIQRSSILLEGSRTQERSSLVGGHAGGLDGIQ